MNFKILDILLYVEQKIDRTWLTAKLGYENPKQFCSLLPQQKTLTVTACPEWMSFIKWIVLFLFVSLFLFRNFRILGILLYVEQKCSVTSMALFKNNENPWRCLICWNVNFSILNNLLYVEQKCSVASMALFKNSENPCRFF